MKEVSSTKEWWVSKSKRTIVMKKTHQRKASRFSKYHLVWIISFKISPTICVQNWTPWYMLIIRKFSMFSQKRAYYDKSKWKVALSMWMALFFLHPRKFRATDSRIELLPSWIKWKWISGFAYLHLGSFVLIWDTSILVYDSTKWPEKKELLLNPNANGVW